MGILDFLKGKENKNINSEPEKNAEEIKSANVEPMKKVSLTRKALEDGSLEIECKVESDKDGEDVTRIIVNSEQVNVDNHTLDVCKVSWYNTNSRHIMNSETGRIEPEDASAYETVITKLNIDELLNNDEYTEFFMNDLLAKNRVARYKNSTFQDCPGLEWTEIETYVGEVCGEPGDYTRGVAVDIQKEITSEYKEISDYRLEARRKKEEEEAAKQIPKMQLTRNMEGRELEDETFEIDYYATRAFANKKAEVRNAAHVILDENYTNINGRQLVKAQVAWYDVSSHEVYNTKTNEKEHVGYRNYKEVYVGADLEELSDNVELIQALVEDLLHENRLEKYEEKYKLAGLDASKNFYVGDISLDREGDKTSIAKSFDVGYIRDLVEANKKIDTRFYNEDR